MNVSKKDLKRSIHYWAKGQYDLWKQLQEAKKDIVKLKQELMEMKK